MVVKTLLNSKEIRWYQNEEDFKIWSLKKHPWLDANLIEIKMSMKDFEKSSTIVGSIKMDDTNDTFLALGFFLLWCFFSWFLLTGDLTLLAFLFFQLIICFFLVKLNRSYVENGMDELDQIRDLIELDINK